ncbi:MAG: hypothetical protein AAFU79_34610, partial [Myxococcota bacterium]
MFKNAMTATPHSAPEALKDTGALLRALEIASHDLNAPAPDSVTLVTTPVDTLEELAPRLSANGLTARVRSLAPAELLEARGNGLAVLVPVESGWLVLGRKRAHVVSSSGERSISASERQLNSLLRGSTTRAILLEPRLNLERLSARSTKTKKPWARLRSIVSIEGPELGALVVYAIVLGGLSLAVPIAVQVLVNTIAFGSLLQPLIILAALLFGVLSFNGLVQVIQWYGVELLERRIFVRVAEDFARRLPVVSFDTHRSVDVREKLDILELPLESKRPLLLRFDPSSEPIIRMALGAGGDTPMTIDEEALKFLRQFAEDDLKDDLESISGIAAAKVSGGL